MDMMLFTNIVLIVLCIFTMLLVWSRNWKRKQAYFEKIKSNSGKPQMGWEKSDRSGMEGFESRKRPFLVCPCCRPSN